MLRVVKVPIGLWRSAAAWSIRGLGIAIGTALAAVYLLLMWKSPPDIDWPHARLRSVMGLYLVFPLLLLAGPIWLIRLGRCLCRANAIRSKKVQDIRKKDRETDL
jgi:hypothetical protein